MKPSRLLSDWITTSGISRADLARELKVCRSVITYWCLGRHRPSPKSAKALEFLSGGKIPLSSWGYAVNSVKKGPAALQSFILMNSSSAHALAREMGVATTTVTRWIHDGGVPKTENCHRISTLIKVKLTPDDF